MRKWGRLPVALFGRGWYIKCEAVLKGIGSRFLSWWVGRSLCGGREGIWQIGDRVFYKRCGIHRWSISMVVHRKPMSLFVCRLLMSLVVRGWLVGLAVSG
jgi:hypothetical protein